MCVDDDGAACAELYWHFHLRMCLADDWSAGLTSTYGDNRWEIPPFRPQDLGSSRSLNKAREKTQTHTLLKSEQTSRRIRSERASVKEREKEKEEKFPLSGCSISTLV